MTMLFLICSLLFAHATAEERRRGVGTLFCPGVCLAACAAGTGGIGFPTPAGVLCEFTCVAACEAATACFDGNAQLEVVNKKGKASFKKISSLVDQHGITVLGAELPDGGTKIFPKLETLRAVFKVKGDWTFYEIIVQTQNGLNMQRHALNTTDDHGWIVVDKNGLNGCVKHAVEVSVGDHVLIASHSFAKLTGRKRPDTTTVAEVVATKKFNAKEKYFTYTDSGMIFANDILTTIFCEHDYNDCKAGIGLSRRLNEWRAAEDRKTIVTSEFERLENTKSRKYEKFIQQSHDEEESLFDITNLGN